MTNVNAWCGPNLKHFKGFASTRSAQSLPSTCFVNFICPEEADNQTRDCCANILKFDMFIIKKQQNVSGGW